MMMIMIETKEIRELLAEYRRDRPRMDCAPPRVQQRYDLITALLEEVLESRASADPRES